jgi:hypothetical protein
VGGAVLLVMLQLHGRAIHCVYRGMHSSYEHALNWSYSNRQQLAVQHASAALQLLVPSQLMELQEL